MDPATTAIMILLSCTPDTLFCRKVSQPPIGFSSAADCEAVLPKEIQRVANRSSRIIGKCQMVLPNTIDQVKWAKLPDSTLMTSFDRTAQAVNPALRQVESAETTTVSIASAAEPVNQRQVEQWQMPGEYGEDFVRVKVTRLGGKSPVTTSYFVKSAE